MLRLDTITLEILRPGPAHNQLLSPLTNYVALCDNRGAVTLNLPFEHRELLRQRSALRYKSPRAQRQAQLQQTADSLGQRVLGAIPTLGAALSQTPFGQGSLIHLRLVLSAAELALLPFELATAPAGFPGEAKPLLLQASAPVTLTREVRSASVSRESWARPPRVLVAAASMPGMAPVPLREHLQALRAALLPWVPPGDDGMEQVLTVLPRATLGEIREACAARDYTHVHLLAHGVTYGDGLDKKFGVALFPSSGNRPDRVGGNRLADALRTHRKDGSGLASPNVVTICACDSGDLHDVIAPGASIAHALHEAGIPWVVASQFPLSMRGSTILCRLFYEGLLRGDDPRVILHHLRQVLRAECSDNHDWGSVVAYAAVPPDFDEQVREARKQQCHRAIDLAFLRIDALWDSRRKGGAKQREGERRKVQGEISAMLRQLDEQLERLRQALPEGDGPAQREKQLHVLCQQGRTEKRRAYILYHQQDEGWREALQRARRLYFEAAKLEAVWYWPLTQLLSIDVISGEPLPADFPVLFGAARLSAEMHLLSPNEVSRSWALGSLTELHLLALRTLPQETRADEPARHAEALVALAGAGSLQVERTRSQIARYLDFGASAEDRRFTAAVRKVLAVLKAGAAP